MLSYLLIITASIIEGCAPVKAASYRSQGCKPDRLAVYKVSLATNWDRDIFPKQYPEWRPPAQWSKLVGRSHDSSYFLFHLNDIATGGMKQFAETGGTDILENSSQGAGGVLDKFNAPAISEGVGVTESDIFVDGNHSMISLVSHIVPSPDWFIGIDSYDLCVEGKWLEAVTLEVDPLDAGTDNGFTFTSPNWPTVPQKPITRITSKKPSHPANSFYYPDRFSHPPIGTFYIRKIREYELSQVFSPHHPGTLILPSDRDVYHTDNEKVESPNDIHRAYDMSENEIFPRSSSLTALLPHKESRKVFKKHKFTQSLMKKYRKYKKHRKGRKATRRQRAPRDCRVSEWSEWSPCSKTCGIGEQTRTRKITKRSKRGGRPCPSLDERKWCGSSRDCKHNYFDW